MHLEHGAVAAFGFCNTHLDLDQWFRVDWGSKSLGAIL
jgi:hypothetical protein